MASGGDISAPMIADDGREGPQCPLYRPRQGNIFKTAWNLLNNVYDGYRDGPMKIVRSSRSETDQKLELVENLEETQRNALCEIGKVYSLEDLPAVRKTSSRGVDSPNIGPQPHKSETTLPSIKVSQSEHLLQLQLVKRDSNNNVMPSVSAAKNNSGAGVNLILDGESSVTDNHCTESNIVTKGQSKSCGRFSTIARNNDPDKYIRLSEIFVSQVNIAPGSATDVLSRTFLESVNDQIRQIRLANNELSCRPEVPSENNCPKKRNDFVDISETKSESSCAPSSKTSSTGGNNNVNINLTVSLAQIQASTGATVEIGKPATVRINVPKRTTESSSVFVSEPPPQYPFAWASTNTDTLENVIITRPNFPSDVSRADEASSITDLTLNSTTSSPLEVETAAEEGRVEVQTAISENGDSGASSSWTNSISNALAFTGESIKNVFLVAEDMVTSFIIPPDPNVMTEAEMNDGEGKIAISVMRLMGIPQTTRHSIYQEALQEVQVVHDVSTGTIDFLHNVINWLCRGDATTMDAFLAKTRILATMQSEVEVDSAEWQQFEKDVSVFTDTVANIVRGSMAGAEGVEEDQRSLPPSDDEAEKEESVQTVSISFSPVDDSQEQDHPHSSPNDDYYYDKDQQGHVYSGSYSPHGNNPFLDSNNNY